MPRSRFHGNTSTRKPLYKLRKKVYFVNFVNFIKFKLFRFIWGKERKFGNEKNIGEGVERMGFEPTISSFRVDVIPFHYLPISRLIWCRCFVAKHPTRRDHRISIHGSYSTRSLRTPRDINIRSVVVACQAIHFHKSVISEIENRILFRQQKTSCFHPE